MNDSAKTGKASLFLSLTGKDHIEIHNLNRVLSIVVYIHEIYHFVVCSQSYPRHLIYQSSCFMYANN